MPAPAADRLDVLATPPESLANLDPDLQQLSDYAALAASMKRFEAQLSAEVASADARPLPTYLAVASTAPVALDDVADTPKSAAHDEDVAASGDTARPSSDAPIAD